MQLVYYYYFFLGNLCLNWIRNVNSKSVKKSKFYKIMIREKVPLLSPVALQSTIVKRLTISLNWPENYKIKVSNISVRLPNNLCAPTSLISFCRAVTINQMLIILKNKHDISLWIYIIFSSCELFWSLLVWRLWVNLKHFQLLQKHRANFNQTCHI